ncbi:MAG: zinc-binding dehydrogenase [Lachnospiraceae bacterium]|nr:zinc-binding dehydrogenase [Lachnospiraceae bacterium]
MAEYERMKFGCLTQAGKAEVRERDLGEIGDLDVVVKQLACNICTTDYTQWKGKREHQGYPMAGGHEGSGIVVATGKEVKSIKVGDFVAHSTTGCGQCRACAVGDFYNCENTLGIGATTEDGYRGGQFGFSNYAKIHARACFKMNPDLDPAEAGFLEPVATATHGAETLQIHAGETVVVIGGGTMGLVNAQVAKAFGARVIVSELQPYKLEKAQKLGLEVIDSSSCDPIEKVKEMTDGKGADSVIVAVGLTVANNQALEMVKKKDGKILFFAAGYPAPSIDIDTNSIHYRRLKLMGTMNATQADYAIAAKLLNYRLINVKELIEEKRYDLDHIQDAFAAADGNKYRVCVMLQDEE